ncbi:MAG: hypothetical protein WCF66_12355 [Pseudolabrys sp.]
MAALFKYFVGIAVILPAVMIVMVLSAVNMGEIFVGIATIAQAPATETPRWNIERLMAEPDRRYVVHGSLSPIYPASPGKELLGKPVYTVPLQIYAASKQDRNYLQQSLSYAQTRPSQSRTLIIFGHGIY